MSKTKGVKLDDTYREAACSTGSYPRQVASLAHVQGYRNILGL